MRKTLVYNKTTGPCSYVDILCKHLAYLNDCLYQRLMVSVVYLQPDRDLLPVLK